MKWHWMIGWTLLGCSTATELSTNVNQDRIYQSYRVTYAMDRDRTEVEAQFRFGDGTGTTLELGGDSRVDYRGEPLERIDFFGTRYRGEGTGKEGPHLFSFVDAEARTYQNLVPLPPLRTVQIPETHRKDQDLKVRWFPPLEKQESISVWVFVAEGSAYQALVESTDREGASEIVFPEARLEEVPNGTVQVELERSRSFALEEATPAGGTVWGAVRTGKRSMILE